MDDDPLVSIVIPVFNGERHLEACVRSILNQTYGHIEVLIADQASTDRSVAVVQSFGDSRIRILPEPTEEMDLHKNWARALSAATGEFVKLVCQDDLLLPDCLSVQVELLKRHPTAAMACGRRRMIDDRDNVLIRSRGLGKLATAGTRVVSGPALAGACTRAGANLLGEPVNVLIRRSALPEPLFDPKWVYAIDIEFYFRCIGADDAVVDNRTVCSFRVSPNQLSAALAKNQARELRALFSELGRRYPMDVSNADIGVGIVRAHLLALARRVLYLQLRVRASMSRSRGDPSTRETRNDIESTHAAGSTNETESAEPPYRPR